FRWLGFWKIAHIWFKISILSEFFFQPPQCIVVEYILFWHFKLSCITNIWSGTLLLITVLLINNNMKGQICCLSMNAMRLLLGDGQLILYFILFSFLLFVNAVEKAHSGDVHCVDWNPLDVNYILTGKYNKEPRARLHGTFAY
ncbi:hypothetical protein ACJX0J_010455, partial [Zea mays]